MIGTKEIMKIKGYQREFEETFGEKLCIDWLAMKGIAPRITMLDVTDEIDNDIDITPEQLLEELAIKYKTNVASIRDRSKRVHTEAKLNDRRALIEFSKIIVKSRMPRNYAAKLINRDRTTLYHFSKMECV